MSDYGIKVLIPGDEICFVKTQSQGLENLMRRITEQDSRHPVLCAGNQKEAEFPFADAMYDRLAHATLAVTDWRHPQCPGRGFVKPAAGCETGIVKRAGYGLIWIGKIVSHAFHAVSLCEGFRCRACRGFEGPVELGLAHASMIGEIEKGRFITIRLKLPTGLCDEPSGSLPCLVANWMAA